MNRTAKKWLLLVAFAIGINGLYFIIAKEGMPMWAALVMGVLGIILINSILPKESEKEKES